jgi:uncharacterized membrane protein YhaH (DUF805 family)
MANWRLNRLWFWILVAAYFVIKIPLGFSTMADLGSSQNLATSLDTPLVIVLALVVGARLKDAGLNRGIGIGATLLITIILPLALLFGYLAAFPKTVGVGGSKQEFMGLFGAISLVSLVLLLALLVWAGTRPPART